MTVPCSFEKAREVAILVHQGIVGGGRTNILDSDFVKFVFAEDPEWTMMDFGYDLIKHDAFSLPFNRCYFEFVHDGDRVCLFAFNFRQRGVDGIMTWMVLRLKNESAWRSELPFWFDINSISKRLKTGRGPLNNYMKLETGEDFTKEAEMSLGNMVTCVGLLSVKGADREVISPPAKIALKREQQRKPPLPTYTVIRFDSYRKAHGGGTHASPRPHWRRGHVRELASGAKTIVRPTVVMADPGQLPNYKVTRNPGGTE